MSRIPLVLVRIIDGLSCNVQDADATRRVLECGDIQELRAESKISRQRRG